MLNDGYDFELAQIDEELVEFLLVGAVQNEVGSEDEHACRQDRQQFEGLETKNPVEQEEDLVNLQHRCKCVVDPGESCLERVDPQLVHVVAHLRLKHLQQVFKQLAQAHD